MKTNFIKTLFVTLFLLSVNIVNAHDFVSNGIYYNITDATNKTVAVTYSGSSFSSVDNEYIGSVVIPESVSYNGKVYSVTSIEESAFSRCSGLTNIEIPKSVTSIGRGAFSGCSGLTSITIPNSVTSIGESAFSVCSGLTSITIPNSVTSIGEYAFRFCSGLTSITIPNSVTSIGYAAFLDCSGLTSIEIPNSVTSIGSYAFNGCTGLTSITIPNSVTSIGHGAFGGTLWYENLPNGVVYINNRLYKYKGDMPENTSIEINEGTVSISDYAFEECSSLISIEIPKSVTYIGRQAFEGCSGLTSIEIPNGVTSIGDAAFSGCSSLTNVTIGKGVINMGGGVFDGCPFITTITLLGEIPPVIINTDDDYEYDFTPQQYETVVLYVPEGSLDVYKSAYVWKEFFNIKEFDNTGIENLEAGSFNGLSDVYYDLNGCIVDNPTKGIYIINGKKVLVK